MSWDYYDYSGPKRTRDGIRLQSARGPVGTTWWGKRWVAALESLCDSGRLSRGKSYARQGQVLSIDVQAGKVQAKVQGSHSDPYRVKIEIPVLAESQWQTIQAALEASPLPLARMLAGEMPPELEAIFEASGQQLFPQRRADLVTDCSCPDWSDPCKHIAAVYYLLAEQFDGDPFLLLKLRGLEREALLQRLSTASESAAAEADSSEPLPLDAQAFWQGAAFPETQSLPADLNPSALLQRLKSPPMWRGQTPFVQGLEPVYPVAAKAAREALEEAPPIAHPSSASAQSVKAVSASQTKRSQIRGPISPAAGIAKSADAGDSKAELILAARRGEIDPEIWAEESHSELEELADITLNMLRAQKSWQELLNLAYAAGRQLLVAEAMIALGEADDAFELIVDRLESFTRLPAWCRRFAQSQRLDLALKLREAALVRGLDSPALKKWHRQIVADR